MSENVEVVRRMYELWSAREYAAAGKLFDPDVVMVRSGEEFTDLAGEYHGLAEVWEAIVLWLRSWEEVRDEPQRFIDLGDRVVAIVKQVGRGRGSGAQVEHVGGFVYTISRGRITRLEAYWDPADALRAAGVEERV